MTQHHAAVESIRAFYLTVFPSKYCIYQQSTRRGGRTMQVCLASSISGPTSFVSGLHVYIFIYRGEVCGRYADDARVIRASVTAPTSVVGSLSKLPSSVIILINGRLFSLGSRVLHFDINPAVLAPHKLSLHLVTYPLHAVTSPSLTNLGPVARLDCGEGQTRRTPAPETHSVSKAGCTMACMRR